MTTPKFTPDPQVIAALWDLVEFFNGRQIAQADRAGVLKNHELMDKVAARLSEVAGRAEPWGGLYPVNVLTEKIGASKAFKDALMTLVTTVDSVTIPDAYQGTVPVQVFALPGRIKPGTLILGASRNCARPACRVIFLPRSGNQRYHSPECRALHMKELKEQGGGVK